jgi:alpha-L-fucosidase
MAGNSGSGATDHGLLLQQKCAGERRSPGGVVDLKEVPEPIWGTLTRDFEMSLTDRLQEEPWQTEAYIGQWHYNRTLLVNHTYKKASLIAPLLVDIVSKSGNLLLSIPLPGHGEPDSDEISFLEELTEWQQVNSEAIKGTRPWKIYGEGPSTQAEQIASYQSSKAQVRLDRYPVHHKGEGSVRHRSRLADGREDSCHVAG